MIMQKITISKIFLFLFFITFINLANAAESKNMNKKNQTQIQFAVIASENAKNDSIKAKVFAEDTANSTAELAKEINKKIETLINFAKNKSPTKLKINSGQQISYPIYSKNNKSPQKVQTRFEIKYIYIIDEDNISSQVKAKILRRCLNFWGKLSK